MVMAENVNYREILRRYGDGKTLQLDSQDLEAVEKDVELVRVASEFIEKIRPIVETRNKLKKESDDLILMLGQVVDKLEQVIALKNVNAQQEYEVLAIIKRELLGEQ